MHIPHLNSILGLFLTANPFICLKPDSKTSFISYIFREDILFSSHVVNDYLCEYLWSIVVKKRM
jgi:hypothetical protein